MTALTIVGDCERGNRCCRKQCKQHSCPADGAARADPVDPTDPAGLVWCGVSHCGAGPVANTQIDTDDLFPQILSPRLPVFYVTGFSTSLYQHVIVLCVSHTSRQTPRLFAEAGDVYQGVIRSADCCDERGSQDFELSWQAWPEKLPSRILRVVVKIRKFSEWLIFSLTKS